ncbi:MAG: YeeE/YedE family protein [Burkholderiaceae bacterium]|nr:YeeE/YedE family protein [Burkholderiaceae bacterium]
MDILSSFIVGLIFGIGLILAGMTDPSKVIGFLDVAGLWDPSLAFVMGGAILVGVVAFRFARKRSAAFFGGAMRLPTRDDIDRRLVLGSLAFGVGWGMAGFCPGPALTALGTGNGKAVIFVLAMIAGMALFELADKLLHAARRERAHP